MHIVMYKMVNQRIKKLLSKAVLLFSMSVYKTV